MAKKLIRLTESDLHRIVKESVHRILKEDGTLYDKPERGMTYREYIDSHGPGYTLHAKKMGGHHKIGEIVKTTEDHVYIPAGSIVKIVGIDNVRGYDIQDVNTGEGANEIGWII